MTQELHLDSRLTNFGNVPLLSSYLPEESGERLLNEIQRIEKILISKNMPRLLTQIGEALDESVELHEPDNTKNQRHLRRKSDSELYLVHYAEISKLALEWGIYDIRFHKTNWGHDHIEERRSKYGESIEDLIKNLENTHNRDIGKHVLKMILLLTPPIDDNKENPIYIPELITFKDTVNLSGYSIEPSFYLPITFTLEVLNGIVNFDQHMVENMGFEPTLKRFDKGKFLLDFLIRNPKKLTPYKNHKVTDRKRIGSFHDGLWPANLTHILKNSLETLITETSENLIERANDSISHKDYGDTQRNKLLRANLRERKII